MTTREAVPTDNEESPSCPLCQGATRPWLFVPSDFARPFEQKAAFSLYWCVPCGYGLVWPRPPQSEIAGFYQIENYYTHSTNVDSAATVPRLGFLDKARQHLAWRFDHSQPMVNSVTQSLNRSPLSICDIGCGNGTLLMDLQQSGHDVLGVEIDPVARKVASGRGLRVMEGTAENMPALQPASFDVVVMSHVLEHTLDPVKAIGNAVRLVKPEGRLIIEVPNNACASMSERGTAWPWLDVPRHLNFFTDQSLGAISRLANLNIVKVEWTGYCRMFSEIWIDEERNRWDHYAASGKARMPPRASKARAWSLLLRTGLAQPARKYDSVRIVARIAQS